MSSYTPIAPLWWNTGDRRRQVAAIVTDERKSIHDCRLMAAGLDLNFYRSAVLFDHDPEKIIAFCCCVVPRAPRVIAWAQFPPAGINPLSDWAFSQIMEGSLPAASPGWNMEVGEGGRHAGTEGETIYTHWFLREWSFVSRPANSLAMILGAGEWAPIHP